MIRIRIANADPDPDRRKSVKMKKKFKTEELKYNFFLIITGTRYFVPECNNFVGNELIIKMFIVSTKN
jgi:hypothetical protein